MCQDGVELQIQVHCTPTHKFLATKHTVFHVQICFFKRICPHITLIIYQSPFNTLDLHLMVLLSFFLTQPDPTLTPNSNPPPPPPPSGSGGLIRRRPPTPSDANPLGRAPPSSFSRTTRPSPALHRRPAPCRPPPTAAAQRGGGAPMRPYRAAAVSFPCPSPPPPPLPSFSNSGELGRRHLRQLRQAPPP
jgi:hypothetical protein